jgi:hypothetical protein
MQHRKERPWEAYAIQSTAPHLESLQKLCPSGSKGPVSGRERDSFAAIVSTPALGPTRPTLHRVPLSGVERPMVIAHLIC